ncbi:Ca2+ transporting ATPase, sarcoplasmic/endoplasmic reticulum [Fonticula alba]|uniref:Calcium-transporting ATPase n=1 Tax=Fonticula alba TaxID=691883 RepID=A0A058Z2U1_FONAL|nr:Ca2+ transporting ATPase, sarcoplasmic/endoplasmic reticulum [Fonticula alba]KCV68436.1 Ca2+ transporting ATPase, sarcoplasmic/endoplasmic reticulum [Fonticula alba]|eukprot:XP_009496868.1 Ca2+ transporting ATPase, sarcoplasmic/endoplasmic reticulum [Fonticula alba]
MPDAHAVPTEDLLARFNVDANIGLTDAQVEDFRRKYGPNELPKPEKVPLWKLILEQFEDTLVRILLGAAVISFILALTEDSGSGLEAFVEPLVILLILVANAAIGVIQETNAASAIEALKEYTPDEAKVLRGGRLQRINAAQLVCGDIVDVVVGDKVPADLRVLQILSTTLRADQAILTGESESAFKQSCPVATADSSIQDKTNLLFSGTTLTVGKARGVVVATGPNTAIGHISQSLQDSDGEDEKTPLKKKLDDFGDMLSKVIFVICILVWLINFNHFTDAAFGGNPLKGAIYYFKIAVALAVAAIPEGLPAVITTCLALGTMKMAKKNAIVRSLPSVETLGATSVICSDKTGTLTTNKMSVIKMCIFDDTATPVEYDIEDSLYRPTSRILSNGKEQIDLALNSAAIAELSRICSLCNDSDIQFNPETGAYQALGEPTEAALKVLAEKVGSYDAALNRHLPGMGPEKRVQAVNAHIAAGHERLVTLEFSRDRKSMSVLVREKASGQCRLLVKGAPEGILERCTHFRTHSGTRVPLTEDIRATLANRIRAWGTGQDTLRCLALATVDQAGEPDSYDFSDAGRFASYESDMTFVSLVGMLDPPRQEVRASIRTCHEAGIRVIVITGDNKETAEAICRRIGVFSAEEALTHKSYTGREYDLLSESERMTAVQHASLFARTEPNHKLALVRQLQALGHVCAMTGDGVNDAPALKRADIGIAMGSGTAVAKEASDMVLADDNFATIVAAVEEGRSIFNNTKQFIRYLISSNIGEVVCIFLTVILGTPEALIPVQLLWVNLVTDGLPATALGFNPPDVDIMRQPPRRADESIVNGWLFFRYMVVGLYVGLATVGGYIWWFVSYSGGPQISFWQLRNFHDCSTLFPEVGCEMFSNIMARHASTMSLSILVTIEMFNAFNSLSENQSLFVQKPWSNPYLIAACAMSFALHFVILYVPFLSRMFSITPLNTQEWIAVLSFSLPVLLVDELLKVLSRWRNALQSPNKEKQH